MISLKILKIALLLVLIIFIFSKKNVFKKILLLITTTHYYLFTEDVMHIFGVYGKTIKKQAFGRKQTDYNRPFPLKFSLLNVVRNFLYPADVWVLSFQILY